MFDKQKAVSDYVQNVRYMVTEEQFANRLAICEKCGDFDAYRGACRVVRRPVTSLVKRRSSRCIRDKWGQILRKGKPTTSVSAANRLVDWLVGWFGLRECPGCRTYRWSVRRRVILESHAAQVTTPDWIGVDSGEQHVTSCWSCYQGEY